MGTQYANLPSLLKKEALFCLWQYETRDGKKTKVPYCVRGYRADPGNKSTFSKFYQVISLTNGYDGIGIGVFDDICAVDIDHCVEGGVLSEMADDIVKMMDSYTEYSPSGTGVRIFFKASGLSYDKERYFVNNRKRGLDIYVSGYTNKFVTATGNALLQKHYRNNHLEKKKTKNQGELPLYYAEGTHEAIIDQSTFDRAGERLRELECANSKRKRPQDHMAVQS